mmetsp:Transcript_44247/g.138909  ORF Transcript_44247/g.138909 Transcript_44247/m.138909 type:complete len:270 (-) Transcript_44247:66-875(-)
MLWRHGIHLRDPLRQRAAACYGIFGCAHKCRPLIRVRMRIQRKRPVVLDELREAFVSALGLDLFVHLLIEAVLEERVVVLVRVAVHGHAPQEQRPHLDVRKHAGVVLDARIEVGEGPVVMAGAHQADGAVVKHLSELLLVEGVLLDLVEVLLPQHEPVALVEVLQGALRLAHVAQHVRAAVARQRRLGVRVDAPHAVRKGAVPVVGAPEALRLLEEARARRARLGHDEGLHDLAEEDICSGVVRDHLLVNLQPALEVHAHLPTALAAHR